MSIFCLFLFTFLLVVIAQKQADFSSIKVKDIKLEQCDKINYSITVNNVIVYIDTASKVRFSGKLHTEVDLDGPVKADLWVYRDIWGIWVPVPCESKVGSCTYPDLCKFGYPENKNCPAVFLANGVPCRCPIGKGNYTINPTLATFKLNNDKSIEAGDYKGTVQISINSTLLSCYHFYFNLYDGSSILSDNIQLNLI